MSGHIFFADRYFGYDDAIYASCRLLSSSPEPRGNYPNSSSTFQETVITPEIRVDCPDEIKFKVVEKVKEELLKTAESSM